ncbi:hypothetical protein WME99_28170 [Sorangium sp. So ce136]|uniref:DUF4215 domain-containing protein n=1 Tax=Sorangium sp. So ce136 TaxID=3133284 RepID=UPI003F0EE1D3
MNIRLVAGLFVLALSTTAGCGDDEGDGGNGGSGGAGGIGVTGSGTGGSGATSTGSNGGAEPTGTGGAEPTGTGGAEPTGTGGAEPTGSGGAEPTGGTGGAEPTGGTGGSGGASSHVYGAACTSDAACPEDYCITETDWGWPSGSCAGLCDPAVGACSEDGVCVDFGEGLGLCVVACSRSEECRDGYTCSDVVGGITACVPECTENAQCPELGMCDTLDGRCVLGETQCTDGVDNEGDDLVDCEDNDCNATCGPLVDAACAGAAPVATTTVEGDTSRGTGLFEGSCGGSGPEQVHLFTPPAGQSGTLLVALQSESNHGLYARAACADGFSELDCQDENAAMGSEPEEEEIEIVVSRGQTVPIFVDAHTQDDAGPYTLDFLFFPAVCGDGTIDLPEECDDDNTTGGDGCSAECTLELDAVCSDALVAVLGDNEGDTTTGTSLFEGSCLGSGRPEKIHTFTPPSDGTLFLTLSSETDLGMYVRTSCVDSGSQVACMDNVGDDGEEELDVRVDGGVPLFIFVDTVYSTDAGPYTLNLAFTPAR